MADFPGLSTTTATFLGAGDILLFADSNNSNRATEITSDNFLAPVDWDNGTSADGINMLVRPSVNSISNAVHTSLVVNATNSHIDQETHSNRGTDPDYVAGTANHAVICGYDSRVNAIAGLMFAKHGDIQTPADHGFAFGGSFPTVRGNSSYAGVVGGTSNDIDDSSYAGIFVSNNSSVTSSDGAVILGGDTSQAISSADNSAILAGVNNDINSGGENGVILGGSGNAVSSTGGTIIGSNGGVVSGDYGVLIGCPVSGTTVESIGAVILGGQLGASTIDNISASSVILGGRSVEVTDAPYSVSMGQDTLTRVRASFNQGCEDINAKGDSQAVRWVGSNEATGNVRLTVSGGSDSGQEFGGYGSTAGVWAGTIEMVYRRGTDVGHGTAQVMISWTAGGSAVQEYYNWTWHLNEATLADPTIHTSTNGGFSLQLAGGGTLTQAVGTYDGSLTHW